MTWAFDYLQLKRFRRNFFNYSKNIHRIQKYNCRVNYTLHLLIYSITLNHIKIQFRISILSLVYPVPGPIKILQRKFYATLILSILIGYSNLSTNLVVMGGDLCSDGREFECQRWMDIWSHWLAFKIIKFVCKWPKINKKWPGVAHF